MVDTHLPKIARKGFLGSSRVLEKCVVNSFFMRKQEAQMECSTPTIKLYTNYKVVYIQWHDDLPVRMMDCTEHVLDKMSASFVKEALKAAKASPLVCDLWKTTD